MSSGEVITKVADNQIPIIGLFSFIWRNLGMILGVIVIVSLLFIGIKDSIEQKSPEHLIDQFGGRIVNADVSIGKYYDTISQNSIPKPNYINTKDLGFVDYSIAKSNNIKEFFSWLFKEIKVWWLFFLNFYFLGFMLWAFYKFFAMFDTTSPFKNFMYAIIVICFLQITYNIIQLLNLTWQYRGIAYLAGLIMLILITYLMYNYDHSKQSHTCLTILLTTLILLTSVGISAKVFAGEGTFKEITNSLIPFQGTAKVLINIPKILMGNFDTISKINYLPNAT
jgi:hypothetical protein